MKITISQDVGEVKVFRLHLLPSHDIFHGGLVTTETGTGSALMLPVTEGKTNRRPGKSEGLPELVGQVPLIGKVHPLGLVGEKNKGGGANRCLGHVKEFNPPSLINGRGMTSYRILQDLVQSGGGYLTIELSPDLLYFTHDSGNPLTGQG